MKNYYQVALFVFLISIQDTTHKKQIECDKNIEQAIIDARINRMNFILDSMAKEITKIETKGKKKPK